MRMPEEFDEIRPYEPEELPGAIGELLADRQFGVVMKGLAPWLPKAVRNGLLRVALIGVKTPLDFQKRFMKPVVQYVMRRYTDGVAFDDGALPADKGQRYTFVSNHRDIVLDSAFLDFLLIRADYPTTVEIGIGDNLLIYPWIKRFVRINKAFTVRRGLSPKETLRASQLMSRYIHFAVTEKRENIWIAQREGRAKDSDDRTQDAVLKMLAMGGPEDAATMADRLRALNIVPLTISYEYDPCDYLKAQELQMKRDDPRFRKTRQDDLDNMRTGIFGYKGRVAYRCAAPVNTWIDELAALPRQEFYPELARRMDLEIHRGYRLYPCNAIACDLLQGIDSIADSELARQGHYVAADKERFERYLDRQMARITLPAKDEPFLRRCMLTMYANPFINYRKAHEQTR